MFGTIRKHQQWLWIFIVAATIISFVFLYNPTQRYGGRGGAKENFGTLGGKPITRDRVLEARRQAEVAHVIRRGNAQNFRPETETYQQLFLADKLREMNVQVSDEQVADWIRNNLTDPQSKRLIYDEWLAEKKMAGFTETEIQQFIRQDISTRHLVEVAGVGSQLITPREAEAEFRRENEQVVVGVINVPSSNYLAGVKIDTLPLSQFYSNRMSMYRIPERAQIAHVAFAYSNFFAGIDADMAKDPNLTNQLEQAYTQRGADSFRDVTDKVLSKEAAFAELMKNMRTARAQQQALPLFRSFANELFGMDPLKLENLETLAARNNLKVQVSAPFTVGGMVDGFEDVPALSRELTKLTLEQPFLTQPVPSQDGIHLIALRNRIPSEIPSFESVRTRVVEDYRREQATSAARDAGRALRIAITNAVGKGRTFAAAAAEQKAAVQELPPINLTTSTIPGMDLASRELDSIKNQAFGLKPGEISDFAPTADGGIIVHVKERKPVDEATLKTELPKYLKNLRDRTKMAAFQDWFTQEFEKSGLSKFVPKQGSGSMME